MTTPRLDRIANLRVALDCTALLGHRTGVGEVAAALLEGLRRRTDVTPAAYAISWRGRRAHTTDGDDGSGIDGTRIAVRPFPAGLAHQLWRRGSPEPRAERWTGPVDVVHALNYVAPPARAPVIVMVHDLGFLRFPQLCSPATLRYGALLRRAVDRGALVHAPSEFVAAEVRDELGLDPGRVVAIHSGVPRVGTGDPARGARLARGPRYALAIGTIEPRKNLPMLVESFGAVAATDPELRLVVAGPDGWDQARFDAAVAASPARGRITRLGYVGAEARRDLLAGASVFVYPSLYEGFGFPPLEAMRAGIPVVASSAGALPEVLGDAAELVDPRQRDAVSGAISRVLTDDARRSELIERGHERAARYTWAATTEAVVALYRAVTGATNDSPAGQE